MVSWQNSVKVKPFAVYVAPVGIQPNLFRFTSAAAQYSTPCVTGAGRGRVAGGVTGVASHAKITNSGSKSNSFFTASFKLVGVLY